MIKTIPITETNHFIILDEYTKIKQAQSYQTERDLELELIKDLQEQGYEYRSDIHNHEKLLVNARQQLQKLNNVSFSDREWQRFCAEYLDKPSDGLIDKTEKIHNNHIYDFVFDDGHIQNIYLLDKKNIQRNTLQVINQFEQREAALNRYDVTILVNGLPLVQIELKKRGVAIREAFNQIHRYSKESFNKDHSLFKFLQIFVISNGTDTRYFANTTKRDKNSFDFTMNWAKSDNSLIKDLKDFTYTFLAKNTLLNVLTHYSVFDTNKTLLIMRPYQIAATERILWKIKSTYFAKNWSNSQSGGYIWHTTGSGKTLTSFKVARLATELEFIDKVFFVVDRKDLDYQTMKEYQRFSPDSVNGSANTAGLKRNIEQDDNKIIVTTIQKLNNLMKSETDLAVYQKQVVFIFDECHRSQFGEAQKNIRKKFKKYYQFGFTGTPIFVENALVEEKTTGAVFGERLHSYVITDAIRDQKVLKFKVDYNDVRPKFKSFETEKDLAKLTALETKEALLHPERLKEIASYILSHFKQKTHRLNVGAKGFNAMFAVSSVEAAKLYYETFKQLQQAVRNPLKIATIFSFTDNETQNAVGEIEDENFEPTAMNSSAKEFLQLAMDDYKGYFQTAYSVENKSFQNYYRDLAQRIKKQEVDLVIVVGMLLTGFDAPHLNTLFVDKNLRYHGLIQAFSRTNRILDSTKTFGNIVTFRDLEQATIEAINLFGNDKQQSEGLRKIVLERSYQDYMEGYFDEKGKYHRGYSEVVKLLTNHFPDPSEIVTEQYKRDFVKLFSEYLRLDNILQNYDEYWDFPSSELSVVREPESGYLTNNTEAVRLTPHQLQDYRSTYNDIRDWLNQLHSSDSKENSTVDWNDVVFEVDLLKSQEINLDYILALIFEQNKKTNNKPELIAETRRMIRSSIDSRAKESLVIDFIHQTNLDEIPDEASTIEAFFSFAQSAQQQEAQELIESEKLNEDLAKRYLVMALKRGSASDNGTELNDMLPKMSPLKPTYHTRKQMLFQKIEAFVAKYKGVGGQL